MTLKDELEAEVAGIFGGVWDVREAEVVPDGRSVTPGNNAVRLQATVLYSNMAASSKLVDTYGLHFAAEIYKAFQRCSAKIIHKHGGEITVCDGDRMMAVFTGGSKNTSAVRSAMEINYAAYIINQAKNTRYRQNNYHLMHVVGIDTSELFVARTGAQEANDLVWVGRAANYAARLSALPAARSTYITEEVFSHLSRGVRKSASGRPMWEPLRWKGLEDRTIYASTWSRRF